MVKVKAEDSISTIEHYIECCLLKGSCVDCPFYVEGRDWLTGRCMGPKQYGGLLMVMLEDIKKELKDGKDEKGRAGKDEKRKSGGK